MMPSKKRDYKAEYQNYQGKPDQIKARAERNTARADAMKAGLVHKGDGKDIDHTKPLSKGGSATDKSNRRVVSASANRSFQRNSDGSLKSQTSKAERKRK